MAETGLEIQGLTVVLGKNTILDDLALTVHDGEFFSLLGNSGCGKSTLLKTIAGLVQESSGTIVLNGKPLHTLPPQKRGVVVMFQDMRLFDNMSVGENVSFALNIRGVSKAKCSERAQELLERVHLADFADRRPRELSGGQAQRVALARALAANPSLLLLDEPFSALDENLRDNMRNLVREIHDELELTTILVTHDQNEALMLSDRLATMTHGKISQIGTPREIYNDPASIDIATYFASGDIVEGTVSGGLFERGAIRFAVDKPDGLYTAVIRPSAYRTSPNGQFTVEDVKYQGENQRIVVVSEDVMLSFSLPAAQRVEPGDTFSIDFDASKILLFSAA